MSATVNALVRITSLSESIAESERNVNVLPELIQFLQVSMLSTSKHSGTIYPSQAEEESVVKAAISALDQVYSHLSEQEENHVWMRSLPLPLSKVKGRSSADEILYEYQSWMKGMYRSCQEQLVCLLLHPQQSLAVGVKGLLCLHLLAYS